MTRAAVTLACILFVSFVFGSDDKKPVYPHFDYDAARAHEIKPHRRTIPLSGAQQGFNQLHVILTITPTGDVQDAEADSGTGALNFWPQVKDEALGWKFTPFEKDGNAVTAEVEEYIDIVPPERLPRVHVKPPTLRPDSKVEITLARSGCFGSCPSYRVSVSTGRITFDGGGYVVARGKHTDKADAREVRKLAKRFIAADFYSMDSKYVASITDNPTYAVSIDIDGQGKKVVDYVGSWVGMPAVIEELEDMVDEFAQTKRWIEGGDGLVAALQAEKFNFEGYEAQVMLKEAANRGQSQTVQGLLESGVSLEPIKAPKPKEEYMAVPFENVSWLNAASRDPKTLQVLMKAGASKDDQADKDLALAGAAGSGSLEGVRALTAYGANPNADLTTKTVTEIGSGRTMEGPGAGSILIYAASSGKPDVVREILRYHPKLEMRDHEGKTAVFAAGDYRNGDEDGDRVECLRLLAQAGADVNARDKDGNTPLHETFLTDVEEELLRLGADVNARNDDGETPIFTTVDDDAVPLFINHGADLTIRNNKGQTVLEAAVEKGPARQEALRKAIEEFNLRQAAEK